MLELDTKAKLEINTASLHEDPYNISKQREVNFLPDIIDGIVIHKVKGAVIRTQVKW